MITMTARKRNYYRPDLFDLAAQNESLSYPAQHLRNRYCLTPLRAHLISAMVFHGVAA
jgi:hypothetical protein